MTTRAGTLRLLLAVAVGLLAGLACAGRALANAGALDTTFGTARGVSYLPTPQADYSALAQASTGELYVLGSLQTSFGLCGVGNGTTCDSFTHFVVGLTRSGRVRHNFGNAGMVDLDFAPSALAVAPNGDVLIAGTKSGSAGGAGTTGPEVLELTPSGSPEEGFGTNGVAPLSSPGSWTQAIAVQPDGHLVLTGQNGGGAFFAERLTPAGAPDRSFGDGGVFTQQFGWGPDPSSAGTDVIVNPSGDLVFTISATTGTYEERPAGFRLEELNSAGMPDTGFTSTGFAGVPGVVALDTPTRVVRQPGHGYVVTGVATGPSYQNVPAVTRFNVNGTVDTTFGRDWVYVGAPAGSVASVVTSSRGVLDLVWNGQLPGDNAVIQLGSDGHPDKSFGPNGVVKQPLVSYGTSGGVLDSAGDLVVLGFAGRPKGSYLARIQLPAAVPSVFGARTRGTRLSLRLACRGSSETDCATLITITTKSGRTVAKKSATIRGGRRVLVTLKLDRRQRRLLGHARKVVVTLRTGSRRTIRTLNLR